MDPFEPPGDTQIGDSVELGDTDLQHQRRGLVIRGDDAARAIRVHEVDHDAVVSLRRTDLRNWVDGHDDVDKHLATRLGVRQGRRRREDIVDRRGWPAGAT